MENNLGETEDILNTDWVLDYIGELLLILMIMLFMLHKRMFYILESKEAWLTLLRDRDRQRWRELQKNRARRDRERNYLWQILITIESRW